MYRYRTDRAAGCSDQGKKNAATEREDEMRGKERRGEVTEKKRSNFLDSLPLIASPLLIRATGGERGSLGEREREREVGRERQRERDRMRGRKRETERQRER